MKILKWVIVVYGIVLFCLVAFFAHRVYYQNILTSSPYYITNRDYTLALFFEKWEKINQEYDPLWKKGNTPKWYDIIKEAPFLGTDPFSKELQKNRAKEYVEQYIKGSVGIDHQKVKDWLLKQIGFIHAGVLAHSYGEVFGSVPDKYGTTMSHDVAEQHLRQVVTFLPFREHWKALSESSWMWGAAFAALFGIPLLLIQIGFWIKAIFQKKYPLSFLCLNTNFLKWLLTFSMLVAIVYFVTAARSEYGTGKMTAFVEGKWFFLKMGMFAGVIAFIVSFLTIWGLKAWGQLFVEQLQVIGNLRLRVWKKV